MRLDRAARMGVDEDAAGVGYAHVSPRRRQGEHPGRSSLHLTRRRLQLKQPRRDLKWPRRLSAWRPG